MQCITTNPSARRGAPWRARVGACATSIWLAVAVPVAGAGLSGAAQAQQDAADATIDVTAARIEQALGDTIASVTVITREQIDATQSRDLAELLSRQVGVEMGRSGGPGSQTSLFLRGTNSNDVLVLVDGVRLNSVNDGAADLGGVDTASIERIEIARGNLSSLYGSEAVGGVIQIFTRRAAAPGGGVLVEAGQGQARDAAAHATVPLGDSQLTLSVGGRSVHQFSAINPVQVPEANPDIDGNTNRNGSLRWSRSQGDLRWSVWAWGNRNDTDWDDPFDSSATVSSTQAVQGEHASLFGYGVAGANRWGPLRLELNAAVTQNDSTNFSSVPGSYDDNTFQSRNRDLSALARVALDRDLDWVSGVEELAQRGASTGYDPNFTNALTAFSRQVASVWTGLVARMGTQRLQANVRHDGYSDTGDATTGLLGWSWEFVPGWKATAQAGTAFRAPTFEDLYYPLYGNPLLRPERTRTLELGLRWEQGGAHASATAFRNRTSDLIEALAPDYVSRNVGHAATDGVELQAGNAFGPVRVTGSVMLDDARDLDTGLALVRRARAIGRIEADYRQGAWRATAQASHSGPRDDFDILSGARMQLGGYTLARVTLTRSVGRNLDLHLRVENLTNARYELVDGYNAPPRTCVAGVEARF